MFYFKAFLNFLGHKGMYVSKGHLILNFNNEND